MSWSGHRNHGLAELLFYGKLNSVFKKTLLIWVKGESAGEIMYTHRTWKTFSLVACLACSFTTHQNKGAVAACFHKNISFSSQYDCWSSDFKKPFCFPHTDLVTLSHEEVFTIHLVYIIHLYCKMPSSSLLLLNYYKLLVITLIHI